MMQYLYHSFDELGIPYKHEYNFTKLLQVNGYLHVPKEYGMFVAGKE